MYGDLDVYYDEICKYIWKIYTSFMNKNGITFYQEWKNTQRNSTFQVPKHFSVYSLEPKLFSPNDVNENKKLVPYLGSSWVQVSYYT